MQFRTLVRLSICFILFSSASAQALTTVPYVDVSRYLGTWYQIARKPVPFESGCVCSMQVLGVRADGNVSVYNSCNDRTTNGPLREIRGYAINDDLASNSKFTVDFGTGVRGKYWIIGLDTDYRYAVVSDPQNISLYVLSKTPSLDPALYAQALNEVSGQVDTSRLRLTLQEGCTYPEIN